MKSVLEDEDQIPQFSSKITKQDDNFRQIEKFLENKEFESIVRLCQSSNQNLKEFKKMKWRNTFMQIGDDVIFERQTMLKKSKLQSVARIVSIFGITGFPEQTQLPLIELQFYMNKYDLPPRYQNNYDEVLSDFELFLTEFKEILFVEAIVGSCRVLSQEEYEANSSQKSVYFTRASYNSQTQKMDPPIENWKKICICQRAQNPDKSYIFCDSCQKWFHMECMKISQQEADNINEYFCVFCSNK